MTGVDPIEQPSLVGDLKTPVLSEKARADSPPSPTSTHAVDLNEDSPTEEELTTLRRVSSPLPGKVFVIAFVELCERFSYYGVTNVCKWYCA